MSKETPSAETVVWRNGAKVSNRDRLETRRAAFAVLQRIPEYRRPKATKEALALCAAHPKKGWARRYLRERGLPL